MLAEQPRVARARARPDKLFLVNAEFDASSLACALAATDTGLDPLGIDVYELHRAAVGKLTSQPSVGGRGEIIEDLGREQVNY